MDFLNVAFLLVKVGFVLHYLTIVTVCKVSKLLLIILLVDFSKQEKAPDEHFFSDKSYSV